MTDDIVPFIDDMMVTTEYLIAKHIRTPEQKRMFLRKGWTHDVMSQLISARIESGLTQAELGERMGKQQSAIARLERGDDIKLSTLFDYLAALDLTPTGQIPVRSYVEAVREIPGADETDEAPEQPATTVLAAD